MNDDDKKPINQLSPGTRCIYRDKFPGGAFRETVYEVTSDLHHVGLDWVKVLRLSVEHTNSDGKMARLQTSECIPTTVYGLTPVREM